MYIRSHPSSDYNQQWWPGKKKKKEVMSRSVTENPRILADNKEKKRKSHEMSKSCMVMGSSNPKEQQLLEAAAFHLILLSNPIYNKGFDFDGRSGNNGSPGGGFTMTTSKKNKEQDYDAEGIVKHNNDNDANSAPPSSSSSSAETIKSGISDVSMEEKEVEDDKRTARRLQQHRLRSIVDIYDVTRPL
ncbi:hypothetical protein L2E82_01757 [Cichorium intybus]|uniref:Uncharacterized protein n=1 Tax=Cichorium intybus TaxID=13427 RepID=A0ACB9GZV6_CICIN|nr:hypothetical protein L2E82_01757 [Cichorium intybus]